MRRVDAVDKSPDDAGGRREVLGPWDDEDEQLESACERNGWECTRLRHQPLGAQVLTINPIVHLAYRVSGCSQREPQHARG